MKYIPDVAIDGSEELVNIKVKAMRQQLQQLHQRLEAQKQQLLENKAALKEGGEIGRPVM